MRLYLRLYREITAFLGWRFPALVLLMALVGITEGLSIALLLPLLGKIGVSQAASDSLASVMLDRLVSYVGNSDSVGSILILVVATAFVQVLLFILLSWLIARISREYAFYRKSRLFRTFLSADWSFFIGRKSGELTSALVIETERMVHAFTIGLYFVSTLVVTVAYLSLALVITWQVTFALIACALFLALSMGRIFRKSFAVGFSLAPLNAELQTALNERVAGIKIVKSANSEARVSAGVDLILRKLERATTMVVFLPSLARGLFEFAAFVLLAAILVFGKQSFGVEAGNIIVVLALFVRLSPRITSMQSYIHNLNNYVHAIGAVDRLEAEAKAQAEPYDDQVDNLPVNLPTSLALNGVAVAFDDRSILKSVDLTVPIPGMVGIVGGSGAGKSTLVHTLIGLVTPNAGSIMLGSHRLGRNTLHAWRRQVGYVPQETTLFHTSVRENLTLAKPEASAAEMEIAAKRAWAHDFIMALPNGYDTIIGDQGVKLSGGQRQRLGIARALLTNPVLLVLDEAMSALDAESESDLMRTLETLRSQMGILIIAHRLGAVRTADAIYVMEAGEVVESGDWNELILRKSRFYSLVEVQSIAQVQAVPVPHIAASGAE